VRECVIELELLIVNILSDAIDLVLAFMDSNGRVHARNTVNFSFGSLIREDGSFLHTDADLHLISWGMGNFFLSIILIGLDHDLEVNINFYSLSLIHLLSFSLLLPNLIYLLPPLISFQF